MLRCGLPEDLQRVVRGFLDDLASNMAAIRVRFSVRVNMKGLGLYSDKGEFCMLDFRSQYFFFRFWTGDADIPGLEKSNWNYSKSYPTQGSKPVYVKAARSFAQETETALCSCLIRDGRDSREEIIRVSNSGQPEFRTRLKVASRIEASPVKQLAPASDRANQPETSGVREDDAWFAVENGLLERYAKFRTRNRALVIEKRRQCAGNARCEVCGYAYADNFASPVRDVLEVHHTNPLAEHDGTVVTGLQDLVILCRNCHGALHSTTPAISVDHLKELRRAVRGNPPDRADESS
jgi:predicted HNH restriction endonuclease